MKCVWCESENIRSGTKDCYWVMPDGKSTVTIMEVPAIDCPNCQVYVTESIVQQIEDELFWKELSSLGPAFRYEQLIQAPRITNPFRK